MFPNDPVMLLSYVNTKLRDEYGSLGELCKNFDISEQELREKISSVGYEYNEADSKFI